MDWFKRLYRQKSAPRKKQVDVIEDLRQVRAELAGVESYFAMESDEDLIEAAIHWKEALEARERHLMKQAREQKMVAAQLPIEYENRERWIN